MNHLQTKAGGLDKRVKGVVKFGETLARHTALLVGGEADYFVVPQCLEDIVECLRFAQEYALPWVVLGNGTNILFLDEGYRGLVIKIGPRLGRKNLVHDAFYAQAGANLGEIIRYCRDYGYNDFDFLVGIPGTVGGALTMNAGIPEGTISDLVAKVTVLTEEGDLISLKKEACNFGYRSSLFQEKRLVILEGEFKLTGDKGWDCEALLRRRAERQPLGLPSPGCVFKNPTGVTAGQLIDKAGLKGYKIGGAAISRKHANFIVNEGGATSRDILSLIDLARERVYKYFGVELKLELEVVTS